MKILEDFNYIADTLHETFKRTYFTLEEFAKVISPKFGATKAKIIANTTTFAFLLIFFTFKHHTSPKR